MATCTWNRSVILPWEYKVCDDCLKKNSYAIWLVKYGCFDSKVHQKLNKFVSVVIDVKNVRLVQVREIPKGIKAITMCTNSGKCKKNGCVKAHSEFELEHWKWINCLKTSTSKFKCMHVCSAYYFTLFLMFCRWYRHF